MSVVASPAGLADLSVYHGGQADDGIIARKGATVSWRGSRCDPAAVAPSMGEQVAHQMHAAPRSPRRASLRRNVRAPCGAPVRLSPFSNRVSLVKPKMSAFQPPLHCQSLRDETSLVLRPPRLPAAWDATGRRWHQSRPLCGPPKPRSREAGRRRRRASRLRGFGDRRETI